MRNEPERWTKRVGGAIGTVLVVAVAARVAWWLLDPVVPVLVAAGVVLVVLRLIVGRYRR